MAEVHGNRTHLPPCSDGTPDLKSGRATSALSTSANRQYNQTQKSCRGEIKNQIIGSEDSRGREAESRKLRAASFRLWAPCIWSFSLCHRFGDFIRDHQWGEGLKIQESRPFHCSSFYSLIESSSWEKPGRNCVWKFILLS